MYSYKKNLPLKDPLKIINSIFPKGEQYTKKGISLQGLLLTHVSSGIARFHQKPLSHLGLSEKPFSRTRGYFRQRYYHEGKHLSHLGSIEWDRQKGKWDPRLRQVVFLALLVLHELNIEFSKAQVLNFLIYSISVLEVGCLTLCNKNIFTRLLVVLG